MSLQKSGGLAALFAAAAFIFGLYFYVAILGPAADASNSSGSPTHIAFLEANRGLMTTFNFVIYVAFGVALVVLALALHRFTRQASPAVADTALAFAIIWATLVIAAGMVANIGIGVLVDFNARAPADVALIWPAYAFITNGLGGGNEIVGGLWILLVSVSAWSGSSGSPQLSRAVNFLGIVVGTSGLVTTIPALTELGAVFGIGAILWFLLVALVLLRSQEVRADPASPLRS